MPEPVLSTEEFLCYRLVRVAHGLQQSFASALRPFGLSPQSFGVLVMLDAEPGLVTADLARRVKVTPQSMGTLLAGLESAGLVRRSEPPGKGHRVDLAITAAGRRVLTQAAPTVHAHERASLAGLSDRERTVLTAMLARIEGNTAGLGDDQDTAQPAG